jgi:thiamine biosynthesis lipoprotein
MSIISKINRNENPELNVHFIRLIETSLKISKQTDGYFDITVGSVVDVWGFGLKKGIAPDEKTIAGLMKFVGFQKIALKNNQLIKENENITIDLNAIAQGYTVDVIAEYFESRNIKNYLIEVGGEVRAGGTKENGEAWHVGIEKPAADKNAEQILQTVVKLNNKSLATSGNYRKYFEKDGRKYSHAIDPFTGFPVEHNLLSVSVIAENCTEADAFATAFLVMGKEKAKKMLEKLQHLRVLFIYDDKNGNFQTEYINGFKQFESEKYKN